jgi:hypothetical protein
VLREDADPAYPRGVPLTPAHPAAVLPLQRLGLPLSALVAGAVAPDAPVYLPAGVSYRTTHSASGIAADVVIGLVVLGLWFLLVRDAVVDLTAPLRRRAPARARLDRRAWLLAPVAIAVGAGTHVLWDSTTHDWGLVVRHLSVLGEELGPLPVFSWLQHLSTLAGTVVVAAYALRGLRSRPVVDRAPAVRRTGLWAAPVPVAALGAGIAARDLEVGVGAALVALVAVAAGWRIVTRRTTAGSVLG